MGGTKPRAPEFHFTLTEMYKTCIHAFLYKSQRMNAWAPFCLRTQRFYTCEPPSKAADVALMSVIVLAEWVSELEENGLNKIRNTHQGCHQVHRLSANLSCPHFISHSHLIIFLTLFKFLSSFSSFSSFEMLLSSALSTPFLFHFSFFLSYLGFFFLPWRVWIISAWIKVAGPVIPCVCQSAIGLSEQHFKTAN